MGGGKSPPIGTFVNNAISNAGVKNMTIASS
jgi:hypothetical protein